MSRLHAITPFTLLDYPRETACIAWFSGCNMRCVYCHNPDIVQSKGGKENKELLDFLEKRRGLLSAVVFSGGEATLCRSLPLLAGRAKELGYKIKLDTNGTRPAVIAKLSGQGTLDYVALDYKTSPERAKALIGSGKHQKHIEESLDLLIATKGLAFEVRTTFHPDLMAPEDLAWMIRDLDERGYRGTYYVQNIASYGAKTIGHIPQPSTNAVPKGLPVPRHFEIAFRNFRG